MKWEEELDDGKRALAYTQCKVANTLATSQSKQFASHSSFAQIFFLNVLLFPLSLLLGVFFRFFFSRFVRLFCVM